MSKSKQINFYFSQSDLADIDLFLRKADCLIIKNLIQSRKELPTYNILLNTEKIFQVYLTRKDFKEKLEFKYIETKDYYYLDILKSYAIEFSIGGFYPNNDKELHRSRFYYIYEYYDKGKIIQKDAEFIRWAEGIFKSFKKMFLKKVPEYGIDFYSDKFIDWVKVSGAIKSTDGTKYIMK